MATRTSGEAFGLESPPAVATKTSGHLILTILITVMKTANGTVPKDLWGLSRSIDLVAPRGVLIYSDESYHFYCQRLTNAGRYPIVGVRTDDLWGIHLTSP